MALSREQALSQYGSESYTGWGETEAAADWKAKGSVMGNQSGGSAGPDISGVPSVQGYVQGQFASEDPALQELTMAMRAREKPADIYGRLEEEAGLPAMRTTATTLMGEIGSIEDYLQRVEPNVSARTRESMVTEAQRQGMVGAEKKPWTEKLGILGTALGRLGERMSVSERGIATKTELAMKGQEMDIEPLQFKYQVLTERNSRLLTGFTIDRQTQLDEIYAKWNRTNQLSDMEWQLANTLAQEESSYLKQLKTSAASAGVTLTGKESDTDILALIGKAAAEQIKYTRSQGNKPTETAKKTAASLTSLRRDVQAGATFEDVMRRYGPAGTGLTAAQVREEYNASSRYGAAKESEAAITPWTLSPETVYKTEASAKEKAGQMTITRPDGSVITF